MAFDEHNDRRQPEQVSETPLGEQERARMRDDILALVGNHPFFHPNKADMRFARKLRDAFLQRGDGPRFG